MRDSGWSWIGYVWWGGGDRGAVRDNEGQWMVMVRVCLVGGGGDRGAVRDNEGQWVVMVRVCLVGGGGW